MYGVKTTICDIILIIKAHVISSKRNKYIDNNMIHNTEVWCVFPPRSHTQFVGDGQDHFEDGHEGRYLAKIAAADHLGVDLQAPLVVLACHTAADLM